MFTCWLESRDISRWKQTKDGCRRLIIIKEWKIIDLCICSAFCYHHVTVYYHFPLLKSSLHTMYLLNHGFIHYFTHTHTHKPTMILLLSSLKKCLGQFPSYLLNRNLLGFRIWNFRCFHFLSYLHMFNSHGPISKLRPTFIFQKVNFSSSIVCMLIV